MHRGMILDLIVRRVMAALLSLDPVSIGQQHLLREHCVLREQLYCQLKAG